MTNFEAIEAYLNGELDEQEKIVFENELKSNKNLAEELNLIKFIHDGIKTAEISAVVGQAQKEYLDTRSSHKIKITWYKLPLQIAASLIGFATIWSLFFVNNLDANNLLKNNSLSYVEPTMRITITDESDFGRYYKNKEYDTILDLINKLQSPTANQYFLTAMAAFEKERYLETNYFLKEAAKIDTSQQYSNEIAYYAGLAYLGNKEVEKAYVLLKNISEDKDNPYSKLVGKVFLIQLKILSLKK